MLYGVIIALRNKGYDWQLLKSVKFDLPVLVVGNLTIGGTGKSPMTEYLVALLDDHYTLATLSRGYGRNTKGFRYVGLNDDANEVGDEPLQFKNKFPDITVAVCESRVEGIERLRDNQDVIILDDAFQHRALCPGFSILLMEYDSLFGPKLLLPAGNFREPFHEKKRADIIVITKSPRQLSDQQKELALKKLAASNDQTVFFSFLHYGKPFHLFPTFKEMALHEESSVLLVTGIANPKPLLAHLQRKVRQVTVLDFPDHHQYTPQDMKKIKATFLSMEGEAKLILTTEKDAQRFKSRAIRDMVQSLPLVVLPVKTAFVGDDQDAFKEKIINYCARISSEDDRHLKSREG